MTVPLLEARDSPVTGEQRFEVAAESNTMAGQPKAGLGPLASADLYRSPNAPPRENTPRDDSPITAGQSAIERSPQRSEQKLVGDNLTTAEERNEGKASDVDKEHGVSRLAVAARDVAVDSGDHVVGNGPAQMPERKASPEGALPLVKASGEQKMILAKTESTEEDHIGTSSSGPGSSTPKVAATTPASSGAGTAASPVLVGAENADEASPQDVSGTTPTAEPTAISGASSVSRITDIRETQVKDAPRRLAPHPFPMQRMPAGPDAKSALATTPAARLASPSTLSAVSLQRPASTLPDRPTRLPLERRSSVGPTLSNDVRNIHEDFAFSHHTRRLDSFECQGRAFTKEDAGRLQLNDLWTLYYDAKQTTRRPQGKDKYESTLQQVYRFNNVADFCGLINNVKPPSKLSQYSTLHLFKNEIKPMWEDPANEGGGKLTIHFPAPGQGTGRLLGPPGPSPPRQDVIEAACDSAWLNLCLAAAGDQFEGPVCGLIIQRRPRGDRISIWIPRCSEQRREKTREEMLKFADLQLQMDGVRIEFEEHKDANR